MAGQAQIAPVAPGQRHLLAGTGDLLQQRAAQQQIALAGRLHTLVASPAHGPEQQGQGALTRGKVNARLRKIRAGAAGDKAMPDTANPLFQFKAERHVASCHDL
ncbi:hypothetical protein D3C84_890700 [compost metagenome]